jgi:hypothetical protein
MYWFRKQIWLWQDYGREHPYRTMGAIAFMLVGGIILGSFVGSALQPLVNPPAATAPSPVFSPTPSIKPMRKPVRTHHELPPAPEPTYRPRPRPSTPHPTPTSHTSSPRPTKPTHTPCSILGCHPTHSETPSSTPTPPPGNGKHSQGSL